MHLAVEDMTVHVQEEEVLQDIWMHLPVQGVKGLRAWAK